MRIVVDECVLRGWFAYLRNAGHTVDDWITVGGGQGKPDADLVAWAQAHDAIVLTADNDLGQIVWAERSHRPTVLQLPQPTSRPAAFGLTVLTALADCEHKSDERFFIKLRADHTYRIRTLPLR